MVSHVPSAGDEAKLWCACALHTLNLWIWVTECACISQILNRLIWTMDLKSGVISTTSRLISSRLQQSIIHSIWTTILSNHKWNYFHTTATISRLSHSLLSQLYRSTYVLQGSGARDGLGMRLCSYHMNHGSKIIKCLSSPPPPYVTTGGIFPTRVPGQCQWWLPCLPDLGYHTGWLGTITRSYYNLKVTKFSGLLYKLL